MEQRTLVKAVRGRVKLVRLERVRVICPACQQQVEAVSRDGRIKGYCAVVRQYVDFLAETLGEPAADQHRSRMSEAMKKWWEDPEHRVKRSEDSKKRQQDPAYRARMSEAIKKWWEDPEHRARMSQSLKKRWQDPDYRAKQRATYHRRRHPKGTGTK